MKPTTLRLSRPRAMAAMSNATVNEDAPHLERLIAMAERLIRWPWKPTLRR